MLKAPVCVVMLSIVLCAPSTVSAAKKITVTISSEPSGANVEWNGQVIGTTPLVRELDDTVFKSPKWLWSGYLGEEIAFHIRKEGYVGKELRLTSGPYRWVNANNTAEKIYFVITGTSFHVSLEPDALTRVKTEAAAAAAAAERQREGERTARGPLQSSGTGFFVSSAGYVATNHHVVSGAREISVTSPATGRTAPATVVLQDKNNDLVILKVSDPEAVGALPSLRIADAASVKLGQTTFTVGFPLGEVMGSAPRLATGTVNGLFGIRDDPRLLQISNPIQPGNSGGPLFNDNGELIGVVVSGLNAEYFYENAGIIPQNVNFAVKAGFLKNLIEMLPPMPAKPDTRSPSDATLVKRIEGLMPLIVKVTAVISTTDK